MVAKNEINFHQEGERELLSCSKRKLSKNGAKTFNYKLAFNRKLNRKKVGKSKQAIESNRSSSIDEKAVPGFLFTLSL
jgi:hypothetical protein